MILYHNWFGNKKGPLATKEPLVARFAASGLPSTGRRIIGLSPFLIAAAKGYYNIILFGGKVQAIKYRPIHPHLAQGDFRPAEAAEAY